MKGIYNPRLTNHAQTLRKNMTKVERRLWFDFLKSLSVIIHRQKVIGNYIVDFYCANAKLVIELDGSQHYDATGLDRDAVRDKYLRGLGLTVKRYSNADINFRFDSVCADIFNFICQHNS